jgi:hypothetical protein
MADIDDRIDGLYRLPLEEFTAARNALAKAAKRADLKELEKPNVAAWAVNQLYWHHRPEYGRLEKSSEQLRGEHRKLLAGKSADIRDAEKAHREAVRAAIERIKSLLMDAGHAASEQTMSAVQETLEALPSSEAPGRLTRPLKPLGFEALAGVSISAAPKPHLRVVKSPPPAGAASENRDAKEERALAKQREQEESRRRERQAEALKALKAAEAVMLRAEDAVKKAEKQLAESRAARDAAVSEYQRARLRAHE